MRMLVSVAWLVHANYNAWMDVQNIHATLLEPRLKQILWPIPDTVFLTISDMLGFFWSRFRSVFVFFSFTVQNVNC